MNKDTVEEFWEWEDVVECMSKANNKSPENFIEVISEYLSVDPARLSTTPSGRSALTWILQSISGRGDKEVLICAFNCDAVLHSVINAKLNPTFYDLSSEFGRIDISDLEYLITPNTAAVVISHFFGVPTDFTALIEKCRSTGTIIIEDCAHTFGGLINKELAGTIGDASIFSFNYDKPMSLGWGGLLLVNNLHLYSKLTTHPFVGPSIEEERDYLHSFLSIMRNRRANIIRDQSLPVKFFRLIGKYKNIRFNPPSLDVGPLRAELGIRQLERYDEVLRKRNRNAEFIVNNCDSLPTWYVGTTVKPAWLKQKILTKNPRICRTVKRILHGKGLRVGNFNWGSVLPGDARGFKNSIRAASASLDIPIHQNISITEMQSILSTIKSRSEAR